MTTALTTQTQPVAAGPSAAPDSLLLSVLRSQYIASLLTLKETIEKCPDELWSRESDINKTWQIAYHALYFAHLYLQVDLASFDPWSGQHGTTQNDDGMGGPPDPASDLPWIPTEYSKEEVLVYLAFVEERVEPWLAAMDLTSESCGFSWYTVGKLEHQFVTIRHIQHHAAQLTERLRAAANIGINWHGRAPRK